MKFKVGKKYQITYENDQGSLIAELVELQCLHPENDEKVTDYEFKRISGDDRLCNKYFTGGEKNEVMDRILLHEARVRPEHFPLPAELVKILIERKQIKEI